MAYTGSQAIETQGTTVQWDIHEVGEVISFSGPGGESGTYDVTNLQSTRKEKRQSLADEGNYTMQCNFVPGDPGQQAMMVDRAARIKRTVIVTYSDETTDIFEAYCTSAVKSGGIDNKVAIAFSLAITGEVISSNLESS
jgi:hypothetical protein